MQKTVTHTLFVLLVLFIGIGAFACGDEPEVDGEQGVNQLDGDIDSDSDLGGDGDFIDDECEEGEILNPFTGECVPDIEEPDTDADGEGDNGDGDNDPGDGDGIGDEDRDCGIGALQGQVCATDGNRLPAAQVTVTGIDCEGEPFIREGETDGSGIFMIEDIPAGLHQMIAVSGSFQAEPREIFIRGGEVNNSLLSEAEKVCVDGDVNILVVQGSFDSVNEILDGLSLDYTMISSFDNAELQYVLGDLAELLTYDIIFFPCGSRFNSLSGDVTGMMNNLRFFVEQGNSIYASDWSHDFIINTFPEAMTFASPPRISDSQDFPEAQVVSTPMQTLLGAPTVALNYNLGGVGQVLEANPPAVVHFRDTVQTDQGTLPGLPLMTSYTDPIGGGTVIYTSFHNSSQATGPMGEILSFMIFQL